MLLYTQMQRLFWTSKICSICFSFWRIKLWGFFLSYQSTLLSICLFLINMRSFYAVSSAQLSSVIRTAKNSNPGNFIFHNILALADSVESQQWAVSNDIWSEKCLPSLPSLSALCINHSQSVLRSWALLSDPAPKEMLPACLPGGFDTTRAW